MQKSTNEKRTISSRRVRLVCAAWLSAGLAQAGISRPADLRSLAAKATPRSRYLVSTILRELWNMTAKYPRHTHVSTLVTELDAAARLVCSAMSPKRGQWQEV